MKLRGKAACLPFAIIFAVLAWLFSQFFDEATSRTLSIGVIVAVIVGLMIYGNTAGKKQEKENEKVYERNQEKIAYNKSQDKKYTSKSPTVQKKVQTSLHPKPKKKLMSSFDYFIDAIKQGEYSVFKELLNYVDIHKKDKDGNNPLDLAYDYRRHSMVDMLIERGAKRSGEEDYILKRIMEESEEEEVIPETTYVDCVQCGEQNKLEYEYCSRCNARLWRNNPSPEANPIFCTNCGKKNKAKFKFCHACGKTLEKIE